MSTINFRSDIKVDLMQQVGGDINVCRSAWVSSGAEADETEKKQRGLIKYLIKHKHMSPFESGFFEFRVEAPRAVRDEAVRHRSMSFSSSSLRYKGADLDFYIPARDRPIVPVTGHKKTQPEFISWDESEERYDKYVEALKYAYTQAAETYLTVDEALGTEASRWISTDGNYVTFYIRCNPRTLMQFLQLRIRDEGANHPQYPMWEIEQMALQMEAYFKEHYPITWEAWNDNGRDI